MRACGIDLKGSDAIFAVVDVDETSNVTFVATNPKKISLGSDNDADLLRNFQTAAKAFLQENDVFYVVIKDRQRRGALSAGAQTFKMEAALQLIEGLVVFFHWGPSVVKFLKKEKPLLPENLLAYQIEAYYSAVLHFKKVS